MDSKKPLAAVLVGLPGSGKSTWAKLQAKSMPTASTDFFIEEYAAKNDISYAQAFKKHYKEALKQMQRQVEGYIRTNRPFIWDQMNVTRKERDAIYNILHPTHEVHFVCFYVPLEICLKQFAQRKRDGGEVINEKKIRDMAKTADFPQKGDLCDKIVLLIHPEWPEDQKEKLLA